MQHLLRGELDPARLLFQQCLATQLTENEEFELARAELARLP
jgi:hypothetical protein